MRYTYEARIRLEGYGAAAWIPRARALLGVMINSMHAADLRQLQRRVEYPDGTIINVSSTFGQQEIQIITTGGEEEALYEHGIFVIPVSDDAPTGWGPDGGDPWVVGGEPNGVVLRPIVNTTTLAALTYEIKTGEEATLPTTHNDWARKDVKGYFCWATDPLYMPVYASPSYYSQFYYGWDRYRSKPISTNVYYLGRLFSSAGGKPVFGCAVSKDGTTVRMVAVEYYVVDGWTEGIVLSAYTTDYSDNPAIFPRPAGLFGQYSYTQKRHDGEHPTGPLMVHSILFNNSGDRAVTRVTDGAGQIISILRITFNDATFDVSVENQNTASYQEVITVDTVNTVTWGVDPDTEQDIIIASSSVTTATNIITDPTPSVIAIDFQGDNEVRATSTFGASTISNSALYAYRSVDLSGTSTGTTVKYDYHTFTFPDGSVTIVDESIATGNSSSWWQEEIDGLWYSFCSVQLSPETRVNEDAYFSYIDLRYNTRIQKFHSSNYVTTYNVTYPGINAVDVGISRTAMHYSKISLHGAPDYTVESRGVAPITTIDSFPTDDCPFEAPRDFGDDVHTVVVNNLEETDEVTPASLVSDTEVDDGLHPPVTNRIEEAVQDKFGGLFFTQIYPPDGSYSAYFTVPKLNVDPYFSVTGTNSHYTNLGLK